MEADTLQSLVPVAVALATGTALPKLIDVFNEWRRDRRREADPAAVESRIDRAERRMRIAIEWGHENRVAAIKAGVPSSELPVLDFRDAG